MAGKHASDVAEVEVLGPYRLRLAFGDGRTGDVDLAWVKERDGVFEPLKDPEFFSLVEVDADAGTIVWPNGADIAPETLYDLAEAVPR